ncbi:MAG: putative sulfate exporter family transporter, partial [Pigmentiphaga sp.]
VGFLALVVINSLDFLPLAWVSAIHVADTFALTMAMAALGLETRASRMRQAGPRVLVLALLLFVWLMAGGYGVTRLALAWL